MKVSVFRKEHFNSAHRLYNKDWDEEMNSRIFGKCSNPNYHGHNYDIIIKVTGDIDPKTGYVIDMKKLSTLIKEEILQAFDHKNLNLDTEEFKDLIPTAENIAVVAYNKLRKRLDEKFDLNIKLYETKRNFVEYPVS